ncbi:MAG: PEGA domain-containing protein [Theionarchaea archaeon]|nr:MAG: hypothetical protein AYK18_08205 [Theionarchaea archaeon DG-70]MBU7009869.1 PEGA domain-containing protein [Theionarchaea archaeon]
MQKWRSIVSATLFLVLIIGLSSVVTAQGEGDTEPPTVKITYPVHGHTVSGIITITIEASDNNKVALLELFIDDEYITSVSYESLIAKYALGDKYEWEYQWDTTAYEKGEHTIKVIATDGAGNTVQDEIIVYVGVQTDAEPPVVKIVYPVHDHTVSGIITITVEASDNNRVALLELFIDNEFITSINDKTSWKYKWDTSFYERGEHRIKVIATDTAGNTAEDIVTVYVGEQEEDAEPPTAKIIYPVNDQIVTGIITIKVEASDNNKVALLELFIDGEYISSVNYESIWTKVALGDKYEWEYQWDTTAYEKGEHTIKVIATDGVGNTAHDIITVNVGEADTEPPIVKIIYPVNGRTVTGIITITVEASDNNRVALLELFIDNEFITSINDKTSWKYSWDTSFYESGEHRIKVIATDSAGNASHVGIIVYIESEDNDGDGYPLPEDCDDGNPEIHPGATEPCGEDYNCDGEITPCTGDLVITASSEGKGVKAAVYINSSYVGETDLEGRLTIFDLEADEDYIVQVEKEGYILQEQKVAVEKDTAIEAAFEMEKESKGKGGILIGLAILALAILTGGILKIKHKPQKAPKQPKVPPKKVERKEVEREIEERKEEFGKGKEELEKTKLKAAKKAMCPFCKNEIEEDWVSCPYCGTRVKDDTQVY